MTASCHIYVIATMKAGAPAKPVKVGISTDPEARLRGLQTASPVELVLFCTFSAPDRSIAQEIERGFHAVESSRRTFGEWFDMSPFEAASLMCCNYEEYLKATLDDDVLRVDALIFAGVNDVRRSLQEALSR